MKSIPCDIVLLPSARLAGKAIAASQAFSKSGGLFTLKTGEYYPHLSLYMLQLKVVDLDTAIKLIEEIASSAQPQELTVTQYSQTMGFIDPEYKIRPELSQLQNVVIEHFNDLRDGMRPKDEERMQTATGLALENFQSYGYKYIGELFRPHITLTRFVEDKENVQELLPPIEAFNGLFDRIGLFEMGNNGTCIREIVSCELQQVEVS